MQERKHSRDDQSKCRERVVGEVHVKSFRAGSEGPDGSVGCRVGLRLSGRKDIGYVGEYGRRGEGCDGDVGGENAIGGGVDVEFSGGEPEEFYVSGDVPTGVDV